MEELKGVLKKKKNISAFYDFSGHSVLKNKNPQLPINQNHVHEGRIFGPMDLFQQQKDTALVSGGSGVMYSGLPSWYQKPELRAPGSAILVVCLNCGRLAEGGVLGKVAGYPHMLSWDQ